MAPHDCWAQYESSSLIRTRVAKVSQRQRSHGGSALCALKALSAVRHTHTFYVKGLKDFKVVWGMLVFHLKIRKCLAFMTSALKKVFFLCCTKE